MIKHFCDRCGKAIPKEYNLDPSNIALCEDTFKDNIDLCPSCMRSFNTWWRGTNLWEGTKNENSKM